MHQPVLNFTGQDGYPQTVPFHPPALYPELSFLPADVEPDNRIYAGVRDLLRGLGYDAERFGTPEWSPLTALVDEGGVVVLKPNFVRHYNEDPSGVLETVVTHPAVLRPRTGPTLEATRRDRRFETPGPDLRARREPSLGPRSGG